MAKDAPDAFMAELEAGVRKVLKSKDASPREVVAAIAAGAKLLFIRHKITDDSQDSFFK
jgi:hypothetical protein